jgi:hypothetical protein
VIVTSQKFILAARSDARISGSTGRQLPMADIRAGLPEILAQKAREDRVQK